MATKSGPLIFQGNFCRKSRVQESNLCDRLSRQTIARRAENCNGGTDAGELQCRSDFGESWKPALEHEAIDKTEDRFGKALVHGSLAVLV